MAINLLCRVLNPHHSRHYSHQPRHTGTGGSGVQYSTVQYSTVQYSTVQYSTVQYSTVQYSTVQYSTVPELRYISSPPDIEKAQMQDTGCLRESKYFTESIIKMVTNTTLFFVSFQLQSSKKDLHSTFLEECDPPPPTSLLLEI